MEDRVTAKKIAQAMGISERAIRERASRESWEFEEVPCRGGKRRVYPLSSLPADVRDALGRVAASEAAAAGRLDGLTLKLEQETAKSVADASRQEGLARYNRMGGKDKARAEARATLLAAFDAFVRATGLPPTTARHVFAVQYHDGVIQIDADVRALLPKVCATSIGNWQNAIADNGISRLAGDYGHRKGTGKIDSTPGAVEYIKGLLYESPGISGPDVLDGLNVRFAGRRVTLTMVQRWLKQFRKDNPRLMLDITSPDDCRSKYQPATGSRFEGIVRPNQRWEMDSTKGDIMLWDGKQKSRHIIVACIDVYTAGFAFWCRGPQCRRRGRLPASLPDRLGAGGDAGDGQRFGFRQQAHCAHRLGPGYRT